MWRERKAGGATIFAAPGAPPKEAVLAGVRGKAESKVKRQLFCHVRYYDGVSDFFDSDVFLQCMCVVAIE